jgi:phenylacetic acid degradation operon negative regulatory protein
MTSAPATENRPSSPLLRPGDATFAAGSARSLLVTILGELVWPTGQAVWTSTLVHLLCGLGFEERTARQAIARGAASDWMIPTRHGREVRWTLGERLARIFGTGAPRVFSLSDPFADWDGTWLAVVVTIPASHRSARRPLYAGLTWAGLGNPAPGLWLTPHVERVDEVAALIDDLDLHAHCVSLVGSLDRVGLGEREVVERGWDLAALTEHYEQVLTAIDLLDPAPGEETVYAFLRMISEWQELPRTDPQLPEALVPDWIGRRVARRIEALRDQWTPSVRATFAALDERPGGPSAP